MDDAKPLSFERGIEDIGRNKLLCSKDSKLFFTTSRNLILVYAVETGILLKQLECHTKEVKDICFSRKNSFHLYSSGRDGKILLWDVLQGKVLKTVIEHQNCWYDHIACGKKALFAHCNQYHRADLVKITLGKKNKSITLMEASKVNCLKIDAKGLTWALIAKNKLTLSRRGKRQEVKLPCDGTCVAFHPAKDKLAIGLKSGKILVYNHFEKNLDRPTHYHWHTHAIETLHFTNDGRVLSGGEEGVIVLWHLATSHRQHIARLGAHIRSFAVTPDESNYIIGLGTNEIILLDAIQETKRFTIQGIGLWRYTLGKDKQWKLPAPPCVDPATNTVAIQRTKQEIQFYDFPRNHCIGSVSIEAGRNYISRRGAAKLNSASIQCFGLSAEGGWLATAELFKVQSILGHPHVEATMKIWKRDMNLSRAEFSLHTDMRAPHKDSPINLIKFRPNSSEFVTCAESGEFGIWQCVEDKWRCRNLGRYRGEKITDVDYSPEGSLLAITFSPTVTIWESESATLLRELSQMSDPARKVRFAGSPSGLPKLLTLSATSTLRMYDLRSSDPPKVIENVIDFAVLGTKIGVLMKEELLIYDSESLTDLNRESSMHRWGIPKVNAMVDHFLLYACGGNDFGVTIISEERQIFSAQYLTAAWNGDEPPSGSEQTVFEQLYAPTEIKRQNKKRKRDDSNRLKPKKMLKITSSVPSILKNPAYSLPSLRYVLQTMVKETEKVDAEEAENIPLKKQHKAAQNLKASKVEIKTKLLELDAGIFRRFKPKLLKVDESFDFRIGAS